MNSKEIVTALQVLQDRVNSLEREMARKNSELHEKNVVIGFLRDECQRYATQNTTVLVAGHSQILPHVPIFDVDEHAKHSIDFDYWLKRMQSKLAMDHYLGASRMEYVVSRLGSGPSAYVDKRYQTAEQMLEALNKIYGNADRKEAAEFAYRHLFQKDNEQFTLFWKEFQRLSAVLEMTEAMMVHDLYGKLNLRLRKALIDVNLDNIEDLGRICRVEDRKLREMEDLEGPDE
ncbi:uncharacterized protein EAE98_008164 [Botrytis deweyae]|uniref:Retrotransposon gag domain-containing protein n=1 Tax=Botrytis deweyae TaxID=2478750 RepID=A0ABQ7IEK5_9HELO|nr:uncharacterized protein EAE98_008164 [Botrytis deweyae]KAF7921953.1 hypothetical protein EAE98_008164 [Botrytis deweyae]